jgi:DNA-binding transcriptional regulator YiaG
MKSLRRSVNTKKMATACTSAVCVPASTINPKEIVAYRKKMNLTQAQFAAQLGISTRVLQSWELADRTPSAPAQSLLKAVLSS